jgi:hypothetical protein
MRVVVSGRLGPIGGVMSNFRSLIAGAIATAACVCISSPSWAMTYNYTVQNGTYVLLEDEDPMYSGSLTVTGTTVTAADIILSGFGSPPSLTFTDITFQEQITDDYAVTLKDTTNTYNLFLVLDNPLPANPLFTGQPVTVDSDTFVFVVSTGNNVAVSFTGSLTATPLPAAFPLFAGGLGVMGLLGRRKKQKAAAVAA